MHGPRRWNHRGTVDRPADLTSCIQMGRSLDNTNDRVIQWRFTVDRESWQRYAFVFRLFVLFLFCWVFGGWAVRFFFLSFFLTYRFVCKSILLTLEPPEWSTWPICNFCWIFYRCETVHFQRFKRFFVKCLNKSLRSSLYRKVFLFFYFYFNIFDVKEVLRFNRWWL